MTATTHVPLMEQHPITKIANQPMQLEARTFPLHGNRLIEASAGTGKTYTIANLFLRLVLGHGPEHDQKKSAHCKPLTVDQILVVTFTEAATGELRDRIRARLHQAREAFEKSLTDDDFIATLMNDLDHHTERARLLLAAERQMDEAAVFTIHGFCQRMLRQHAFESGTLFSNELITDESHLLEQSAADFWRTELYPLNKPLVRLARSVWKTPGDLLKSLRGLLGKPGLQVETGGMPDTLERFNRQYVEPALTIRNLWRDNRHDIEDQLLSCGLKKNSKPFKRVAKMAAFANSDALFPDLGKNESWEIYGREILENALAKNGKLPTHRVFALIEDLLNQPASIQDAFKSMMLARALSSIQQRSLSIKDQKHQMSFNDLLTRLHQALHENHGEQLATKLRVQFPVAMIDEFQDTDPLQYAIFSRIYPSHSSSSRSAGLFMIGDPKQAIYAFRGADIFTYMQARNQVSAHYSLDTNWRSGSNMVDSVNRVFEMSLHTPKDNDGRPPFIYKDIPFLSVKPSPKADKQRLLEANTEVPALTIWWQDNEGTAVGKTEYEQTMTLATASEVNRLLSQAQAAIHSDENQQPLKPGDIAILVRTGRQGLMIREALAKQGIPSVYLSSSDSVFASNEAVDVLRILTACLNPGHDRTLRSALATPLLDLTAETLDALNDDELAWERAVEEFSDYHQIWMKQGVLPMLRVLVQKRKLAEQLLAKDNGERRLTNLLHVGELLAAASLELESPHALQRWLSEHISKPDTNADEQQLHLESERNRVQIVTIHKSKGLEYPVVFLPYICSFREAEEPVYHDSQHTTLDLSGDDQALIKADKERLAEDIRLLYVALTRSIYRCYMGMAPVKSGSGRKGDLTDLHRTAIGWLLNGPEVLDYATLEQQLKHLAQRHPAINFQPVEELQLPVYRSESEESLHLVAAEFRGEIQKDWWVTSYSALSRTSHSHKKVQRHQAVQAPDASMETAGLDIEVMSETEESVNSELQSEAERLDIFTFPKGARPGTFLHALFENLENLAEDTLNSQPCDLSSYVLEHLQTEGFDEKWCPTLENMLDHCLHAPLNDTGLTLGDIPIHAKKVEMEFYLPVDKLRARELNAILQSEDKLSAQAELLDFVTVKGMLKGFIDLTFEHNGRWYVLDYKSNWLGDQLSDYTRENMQNVMIEHRYDLQYQLYSLALHRLLSSRLPDYDFERHFGGVYYLFLRGIRKDEPDQPGIFHCRPNKALIEKLDRLFYGDPASSEESSTRSGVSS
ncbi:exodeoxyribonuclease V subunit beta [Endozoicomonas sp. SESOKO4]|uniref:exodeoxyribonuclease V subunit beta n=5 Tax=unclassified Endozoicomonas TaxID=2644528 RepID=UPI002148181F|nr:exodeoxyribonuclease V subunit beta [Endozoicomonas sp. SESOKO4]